MNVVFIMTDTQDIRHCGAYAGSYAVTPNLDKLAAEGMRFDRGYTNCPLCTPARGAIFTGLHPGPNGATYNDATPYQHVPRLGSLLREQGVRAAYTGKWHLDGGFYDGFGEADGGFEAEWWYDGACYRRDLGEERFLNEYKGFGKMPWEEKLTRAFKSEDTWGHRVADRAIDFLEQVHDDPFVLCISFDEPHGPYMCPCEFLEGINVDDIEIRPNVNASLADKPQQQKWIAEKHNTTPDDIRSYLRYYLACTAFVDHQIGRVIDTVKELHGDDTCIIFTSDHGEMMGSHGLWSKGPVMYEEATHVPFIIQGPNIPAAVCDELVSHVDIVPTVFDLLEKTLPEITHGRSLLPELRQETRGDKNQVLIAYERFGNGLRPCDTTSKGDEYLARSNEFYPIRCLVRGQYKLAINLLETDELYDLKNDPYEMNNLINEPSYADTRDELHRHLLQELKRVDDPVRCKYMAERHWHALSPIHA